MTDQQLHQLRQLGEELRSVFAAERRAITTLDHEQLTLLAQQKQHIATALAELVPHVAQDEDAKALFTAIRNEAHATALLAATATSLVNARLGRETHGYDRRANRTITHGPAFRSLRY
ncbi:MAG: hypothetical protein QM831_13780 [Kofleriaceae bacterium]